MTELYVLNLKNRLHEPVASYLNIFTPERRDKILHYKHLADQNRTLWAEILARHIIAMKTDQNIASIRIFRDNNGKPYTSPEYNLEFSISHSGEYAALSSGDKANGVDVERLSRARHDIAERFFTHEERMILAGLNEEEFRQKFMCYWTLKESYMKCTGMDLMSVIRNVNCEMLFEVYDKISGRNFFIDDYVIGICSEDLPDSVHEVKIPLTLMPTGH